MDVAVIVAVVSTLISAIALIVTVVFSILNQKQYLDGLSPALSFRLIEYEHFLYLSVSNAGQTPATDVKVKVLELQNNGDIENLVPDALFQSTFELYPKETIQGAVGIYGENIATSTFPRIKVKVSYKNGKKKKLVSYVRTITFTAAHESKIYANIDLDTNSLDSNLASIARSNTRLANYFDGTKLYYFDELNILTKSSLKQDLSEILVDNDDNKQGDG